MHLLISLICFRNCSKWRSSIFAHKNSVRVPSSGCEICLNTTPNWCLDSISIPFFCCSWVLHLNKYFNKGCLYGVLGGFRSTKFFGNCIKKSLLRCDPPKYRYLILIGLNKEWLSLCPTVMPPAWHWDILSVDEHYSALSLQPRGFWGFYYWPKCPYLRL